MGLYDAYQTDQTKETSGVWVNLARGGAKVKLARADASNPAYAKAIRKRVDPGQDIDDLQSMDESEANRIMAEVYAEAVIMGWENFTDEKGKKLECNFTNAVKILSDPRLHDLFAEIQRKAGKQSLYRAEQVEADAKN